MLSSLTPVGERSRSQRWTVTVMAFTIGNVLGGVAVGAAAGWLGTLLDPPQGPATLALAAGLVAAVAGDLAGATPPSLRRQVDRTWMTRYRGWVYGLGYGVQLGTGLVTFITSWATWVWLVALVLVADLRVAMLMGMLHGLVRGLSLWTTGWLTSPAAIRSHHRRLVALDPWVRRASHAALVVGALAVLAGRAVV